MPKIKPITVYPLKGSVIVDIEIMMLTPEIAKQWLEQNTINRPIKTTNIKKIARIIELGEWVNNGQAFQRTVNGDMLNGQHRCEGVIASGVAVEILLVTLKDASTAKAFDQGSSRTYADVLGAAHEPNHKALAAAVRESLRWERWEFYEGGYRSETIGELNAALQRHPSLREANKEFRRLSVGVPLAWSGICTVLVDVARSFDKDLLEEFVSGVATGLDLPEGDPRLTLRKRLNRESAALHQRPVSTEIRYWWVRSWDSFAAGTSLLKLSRRSRRMDTPRGYEEWMEEIELS